MTETHAHARQPWRPSPFIVLSGLAHLGAAAAWLWEPGLWAWSIAIVAANQAALGLAGLRPRSRLLGPNWTALPPAAAARGEVAITLDDGPDPEVTPAVLDLLDRHGAKATFFCIGERALRHPELCREIVRRGHAVGNHSFRHGYGFATSGLNGFERELALAQEALTQAAGIRPSFFRAPFGFRNPLLDPALSRLGLTLASWTRRGFDTRDRDPAAVVRRLLRGLKAGDILLLHDGNAARTATGEPVVLHALPPVLDAIAAAGLRPATLDQARMTAACASGLGEAAAARYRPAGRFAWRFARGKLAGDPVFAGLLARGLIPEGARVLDLGCGQGLLGAWLVAARDRCQAGAWPADWPPAPRIGSYRGIELLVAEAQRARSALGDSATIETGDIRAADLGSPDTVVILDVFQFIGYAEQEALLARIRAALPPGGRLLLRVGDAEGGAGFRLALAVDWLVALTRGHGAVRFQCRSLREWLALLDKLGFSVESVPMSQGTRFANMLLIGRRAVSSD
jgi:peptidoglycan/xylan/chitin deacetylase (PgdA/CDA1 family)/SAM-dependent methyltransferase